MECEHCGTPQDPSIGSSCDCDYIVELKHEIYELEAKLRDANKAYGKLFRENTKHLNVADELRTRLECANGMLVQTSDELFRMENKYEALLENLRAGHYAKQGCNLPHKEKGG